MKQYFEDLWQALPHELEPPDFDLRKRFLLDHVRGDDRVLDLGAGTGAFTAVLARVGAQVIGAEVAEAALERARGQHPELKFTLVPVCGPLPFADGAFDVVWASEVIEHVGDTARWLSEVRRVLRPRGRLLLTTPNHGRMAVLVHGIEHFSDPLGDHLHLYTRRSLRRTLEEFDFTEIHLRATVGLPPLQRLLLASGIR